MLREIIDDDPPDVGLLVEACTSETGQCVSVTSDEVDDLCEISSHIHIYIYMFDIMLCSAILSLPDRISSLC